MSRIYGGFHFMFANRDGKASGKKIGDYVARNFLLPNNRLPLVALEGLTNGAPVLRVHGHVGAGLLLQASADLSHWAPVWTNTAMAGGLTIVDTRAAGQPLRFYRAVELNPN